MFSFHLFSMVGLEYNNNYESLICITDTREDRQEGVNEQYVPSGEGELENERTHVLCYVVRSRSERALAECS